MKIEFLSWYRPGDSVMVCRGDEGCGAVVVDTETHLKFHKRLDSIEENLVRIENRLNFPELGRVRGTW